MSQHNAPSSSGDDFLSGNVSAPSDSFLLLTNVKLGLIGATSALTYGPSETNLRCNRTDALGVGFAGPIRARGFCISRNSMDSFVRMHTKGTVDGEYWSMLINKIDQMLTPKVEIDRTQLKSGFSNP